MSSYDYDLFVIGAGSGGVRAARLAALSGARVAVAEESRVGGTCVVRGCVPKKFMVFASDFRTQFDLAKGYGWDVGEPSFDWCAFRDKKDAEISRLSGIYVANLMKAGADLLHGRAVFVDPHTVEVDLREGKRRITAGKILIATGGRPKLPDDVPGVEHAITSDEVFHLPELPKRMLIVGGGYIAVEFACIFHGLGVEVTLAYRGSNLLRGFDEDVRAHLADELRRRGVRVALACRHERIEARDDGIRVSHVTDSMVIESEVVMFATGREPHVKGLGLDKAGVKLNDKGAIAVDEFSQTSVPHIWAVGDVTDRMNLTPVAIREAQCFAETVFYDRPMRTLFAGNETRMLMKLIVDPKTDKVLGCHIVGEEGPETIQLAAIAVKAGLTKAQWDATCALHPTVSEELVTLREKYLPPELAAAE